MARIEEIIEYFDIDVKDHGDMFCGRCPIHDGDNHTALNLYKDGYSVKGYWCCWTKHCDSVFKPTIIGFIRGLLSKKYMGWEKKEDKDRVYSFHKTLKWISEFLGQKLEDIKIDEKALEQRGFINSVNSIQKTISKSKSLLSRVDVRKSLEIPARFFLDKQYSSPILDEYDVGFCGTQGKPMSDRVVVPVYDEDKMFMVACSGRTIHPECKKCKFYHKPGPCPLADPYRHLNYCKWRHNGDINSYLYNFWNAKKEIKKTGVVVIVEGPSDVWRLVQYGITNCVAIFSCKISDSQQILLESCGAYTVIDCLDNDEAGRLGSEQLQSRLGMFCKILKPEFKSKDIGEMPELEFKDKVLPVIQRAQLGVLV